MKLDIDFSDFSLYYLEVVSEGVPLTLLDDNSSLETILVRDPLAYELPAGLAFNIPSKRLKLLRIDIPTNQHYQGLLLEFHSVRLKEK